MKNTVFRGSGVALVTPFAGDGSVDYETLGQLIEMQIAGGTDALIVCGTTGESATMTEKERLSVIEYAVWKNAGRIPVIAGTGTNNTEQSVFLTRKAEEMGADAALAVCPYYNRPTAEGLRKHFTALADCSGLPVLLYNVPSRTGSDLPIDVLKELAAHENILGIKQADPSVAAVLRIVSECGEDLPVYAGDDGCVVPFLSLGAQGVISVAANVVPHAVHSLCSLWFDGDRERAREMQIRLYPLIRALFAQTNPIPVKAALELLGYSTQTLRLPMTPASDQTREALRRELDFWFDEEHASEYGDE